MKHLIIILMFIPTILNGQGWQKTFGFGRGTSVKQTIEGGYIVTGYEYPSTGGTNVYLIKTNEIGDTIWTKTYGENSGSLGLSVQQTSDGGYIITGSTRINSTSYYNNVYLIKTNEIGDTVWTKTFGGNLDCVGNSVQQTSDGGYIITGSIIINSTTYQNNVYLIKTNEIGDTVWTKTFGGNLNSKGNSVQQTVDEGYIITGSTGKDSTTNSYDVYLIKTNEIGDTLWTKTYGEEGRDAGSSVKQTTDGGYIITGYKSDGFSGVYLIKTDDIGNAVWIKAFGGSYVHIGNSVQQTTDDGYIIAGTRYDGGSDINVFLIKTDSDGDIIWNNSFGGQTTNESGYSVQQTTDGGYIITGELLLWNPYYTYYVYLIKTDANGVMVSTTEKPVPNPKRRLIKIVDMLGKTIVKPKTNSTYIEIYDDGTTQKKIKIK